MGCVAKGARRPRAEGGKEEEEKDEGGGGGGGGGAAAAAAASSARDWIIRERGPQAQFFSL